VRYEFTDGGIRRTKIQVFAYYNSADMSASRKRSTSQGDRVGIRDVAAAAGVSITTVSDALNGKGRLPEATRKLVRETADRLGYRPSAAARTLRTGKSGLIGLMLTTPFTFTEVAYFAQMTTSATSTALDMGYGLVVVPTASQFDVWASVALDGAIVLDPLPDDPVLGELHRRGIPIVTDGREVGPQLSNGWVDNDHTAGTFKVLDHLVEAGARQIGMIGGTTSDNYTQESMAAYRTWCALHNQEPIIECFTLPDRRDSSIAAHRMLMREERPDAVYGIYDPSGGDLLEAARALNLRVPHDLMVACCSENSGYATVDPPVTTLSLQPGACGASAVELLIDAMEHPGLGQGQRLMPSSLVVRASTRRSSRARVR
jgi:DNA-binding LacI/PurR family transcriptional regulator